MKSDQNRIDSEAANRSRGASFWMRIARIVIGLFGLSAVGGVHAANEQLTAEKMEIEKRVLAAREVIQTTGLIRLGEESVGREQPDKVTQWYNWPNWNNWRNWRNW